MVIQAQAGQRLISDAAQAGTAFRSIEASGREALVELRGCSPSCAPLTTSS